TSAIRTSATALRVTLRLTGHLLRDRTLASRACRERRRGRELLPLPAGAGPAASRVRRAAAARLQSRGMSTLPVLLRTVAFSTALVLAACGPDSGAAERETPAETPAATPADTPAAAPVAEIQRISEPEVHHAICGCQLAEVKRCGNYVELAGQHVPLVWPELGVMEYCKQGPKGADIEITGEMKDGKFVAETYRRVE